MVLVLVLVTSDHHLMHGVGQEDLQGVTLAGWLLLQPAQQAGKPGQE